MAYDFPATPTDGQVFTSGNISWQYVSATGAWQVASNTSLYTPITKTASYTLASLNDASNIFLMNVASANNFTVPAEATINFTNGTQIQVIQIGAGQTTLVPASITTATYSSGGAAAATTFVISASNASIAVGQLVTGTGFAANTLVTNVAGTTITVAPAISSQVSGTITFSVGLVGTPGLKLRTQWSAATLIKTGTNGWVVVGDVTA